VAIPGFTINRVVALSTAVANKTLQQSPIVRRWAPTAIGLGVIPLIIHPIDHLVDSLLDSSTRKWANDYVNKQE
jgi:fission process protein 1